MKELSSNLKFCYTCEMKKYSSEKCADEEFARERLNEFYPEDEFFGYARICQSCHDLLMNPYLNK